MKRKIATLALLICTGIMPLLQSCNKYPEGPAFSLRTRTERVSNKWKVENYKINDSDYTSLVSDYTETFNKKGTYSYEWGSFSGSGLWGFTNDDKNIQLSGNDDQSSRKLVILKLEEKAFWYFFVEDGDRHELHLVPNN